MGWSERGLSRREFARLGAMGAAATGLSRGMWAQNAQSAHQTSESAHGAGAQAPSSQEARRIGYAIIGLGEIARHFMPGCRQSQHSQVTALVSGDRAKAERIAADYGVPKESIYTYEDFDRIRDNKAVDAVYIALPNSMHAEFTTRSAKAGKHVLCEKPMSVSVKEAEQMIAACHAANVKLMIAYRMHYDPLTQEAIGYIRDGQIGEVQAIESAFGFDSKPGVWRLNKKLGGGGPLVDVGIYSLNATRYLTGEEPAEFRAFAATRDHDGRFNEVEETDTWTMRFPSGILASCSTTYGAQMEGFFKVHGTKGWVEMEPAFSYEGLKLRAKLDGQNDPIEKATTYKDPTQFMWEADHMAECILNNRTPKTSGEEGLKDMQAMTAIYKAAGLKMLGL